MINKNFLILLLLFIIIGFSFGFFTSGKNDKEPAATVETTNLTPIAGARAE